MWRTLIKVGEKHWHWHWEKQCKWVSFSPWPTIRAVFFILWFYFELPFRKIPIWSLVTVLPIALLSNIFPRNLRWGLWRFPPFYWNWKSCSFKWSRNFPLIYFHFFVLLIVTINVIKLHFIAILLTKSSYKVHHCLLSFHYPSFSSPFANFAPSTLWLNLCTTSLLDHLDKVNWRLINDQWSLAQFCHTE